MKTISSIKDIYIFIGLLAVGLWVIPLTVPVSTKGYASVPTLPECGDARSIDWIRGSVEEQSGQTVLGLHGAREVMTGKDGDFRTCVATIVTQDREAAISYSIGWHSRKYKVPFWTGDGL
ncbi:hypothetical protein [Thalassospira marina]|uniref:Uncharacterized protein n=1 Tax=Thalassospira marina TaxID=2048283 RepID=A0A2N3KD44_9PROT|nr:hypothetical protein [Thalassospira marina]PKR48444.1 hypothetical protein COO20_24600 [Thalassospira marina]